MNREILRLAIPSIVSNITVPLLGLIDVAITGHFGAASFIGAIAVGSMVFNMLYWNFGFLRMGTSGLTAQAFGRGDRAGEMRILVQASGVALAAATLLLLLMIPVERAIVLFADTSPEVAALACEYYRIVLWGAPAMLLLYAFKGWFIGMQNTAYPMYIAIAVNVVNIAASLLLVYGCGMKIAGVACGTLIAQYSGILLAVALWFRKYRHIADGFRLTGAWNGSDLRRFFSVNSAIFFRTLCLVTVTVFFTWAGGKQGEMILAVNTLLMQLFTIFSYFLDGFAYAGESLAGRFTGAGDRVRRKAAIKGLFAWATGVMLLFTCIYAAGGKAFLSLLTDDANVLDMSAEYFWWVLAVPVCGYAAFLWDGILIGATEVKTMFYAMLAAAIVFFAIFFLPPLFTEAEVYNNHRLWFAFLVYLVIRGVWQTCRGIKL